MSQMRKKKGGGHTRSLFERKILVKSPESENKAQRKIKKENPRELVRIILEISSENYQRELSSENYQWESSSENYDRNYHLVYQ